MCKGLTGANAPTKVAACTDAIKDGKLAPSDLALACLNRGLSESGPGSEARSKDDYKAAIRLFNELILGSPMNPYYYTQRGVIYQTIGEADRAILDYSNDAYGHDNLGIIYLKQGDYAKAIAEFNASLKLDAQRARALYGRGLAKTRSGDAAGGNSDMGAARTLQPAIGEEFTSYGVR